MLDPTTLKFWTVSCIVKKRMAANTTVTAISLMKGLGAHHGRGAGGAGSGSPSSISNWSQNSYIARL